MYMYVYIYIYIYVCVCVYVCICMYINTYFFMSFGLEINPKPHPFARQGFLVWAENHRNGQDAEMEARLWV